MTLYGERAKPPARVAELADAEGLNPSAPQGACGFEPRPGHPLTWCLTMLEVVRFEERENPYHGSVDP